MSFRGASLHCDRLARQPAALSRYRFEGAAKRLNNVSTRNRGKRCHNLPGLWPQTPYVFCVHARYPMIGSRAWTSAPERKPDPRNPLRFGTVEGARSDVSD